MTDPAPVRYRSPDEDSARWNEFAFRPGDIVISTRSKSGTTWVQMICALLVFQRADLPAPLALELDHDLARRAAETAYRAAPDDETSRLDMIAVAAATGHADLVEQRLVDEVLNRSDDGLGPVSLPARTSRIINQRGWDQHANGSSP